MKSRTTRNIANALFWVSSIPGALRFFWKRKKLKEVQQDFLSRLLQENALTDFGRHHGFDTISSIEQYQQKVPLREYEDLLPWIDCIANQGKEKVLTRETVELFEPTSGSTSASKLIPFTKGLIKDFQNGIDPWMFSLYLTHPKLLLGTQYWATTPWDHKEKKTQSGIPIGFADESLYLSPLARFAMKKLMAVPKEVSLIQDLDVFRYVTNLFLLQREDLRLISVWSPTYLFLLLRDLKESLPEMIADLKSGEISCLKDIDEDLHTILKKKISVTYFRVRALEKVQKDVKHWWNSSVPGSGNRTLYDALWPKLEVISMWCDSFSSEQVDEVSRMFRHVSIEPKGLLATEAFVTLPSSQKRALLSYRSHFFEFEKIERNENSVSPKKIYLAHELEVGEQYNIVLTTSGGLYRYKLHDIVEVEGFWHSIPMIKFKGRDHVVDLVGEKLSEQFVQDTIGPLVKEGLKASFWMLAPQSRGNGVYRYILFIECEKRFNEMGQVLRRIMGDAEEMLLRNYHYQHARKLGQLESLCLYLIQSEYRGEANDIFFVHSALHSGHHGQHISTVKATNLHHYQYWEEIFSGYFFE
jgi:hypothetical protein